MWALTCVFVYVCDVYVFVCVLKCFAVLGFSLEFFKLVGQLFLFDYYFHTFEVFFQVM